MTSLASDLTQRVAAAHIARGGEHGLAVVSHRDDRQVDVVVGALYPPLVRQANLLRASGLVYARLLGSGAESTMKSDSDIDLAIIAKHPLAADEFRRQIEVVSEIVMRPVDIVDLRLAHGAVFDEALNGIELYCDDNQTKAGVQYRRVTVIQDNLEYARASFNAAKMFSP